MFLRFLLLMFFALALFGASAQKKKVSKPSASKSSKTKTSQGEFILPPPPPVDMGSADTTAPPPLEELQPPVLNFDTSAAAQDEFTFKIVTLLKVTNALEADIEAGEKALNQTLPNADENPTTQLFKQRFLEELRVGRMRRWVTNMYIREYRQAFTPTEIDSFITFYQTDAGKKMLAKQRQLMTNAILEGQKIGGYTGQLIMQEILKEQSK